MRKIYGIRHHGPGSAKSLKKALQLQKPDLVLIEGPTDANHLIEMIANKDMKTPLAILVYRPDNFEHVSYYPFAEFSPEWQAMLYALQNDISVQFMDLPLSMRWHLEDEKSKEIESKNQEIDEKKDEYDSKEDLEEKVQLENFKVKTDPLNFIAQQAGYEDGERWWDVKIETQKANVEPFEAIKDLMGELRNQLKDEIDEETLLREAFMRKSIRLAEKEGLENIAVVCGAWHAPVLQEFPPKKEDDALLKGIKKVKTDSTWIPWTFERLATQSGYGAGITSPAWYELLFKNKRETLIVKWMTKTAHLFRKEGLDSSPALTIEATRLAQSLANLRGLEIPSIPELLESVQTIFCFGDATPIDLVRDKLIVGNKIGKISEDNPSLPLQQDFEKLCKKFRLKREDFYKEIKLDLRKENDLAKSRFFHRLQMLGINWCSLAHLTGRSKSTFHEDWEIKWMPEHEIRLIEVAAWGNSIEDACLNLLRKSLKEKQDLAQLTSLLQKTILADLPLLLKVIIENLKDKAALYTDILQLMQALPPLVEVSRYGDVRKTETAQVVHVINAIVPRLIIALPNACVNLNEEATDQLFKLLHQVNSNIQLLQNEEFSQDWFQMLEKIAEKENIEAKISGGANRLLFDQNIWEAERVGKQMSLALSLANEAQKTAFWIEGFLHGSGLLLIHNEALWQILDQWVSNLNSETFQELLPLLRRTFANFTPAERSQMGDLAKNKNQGKQNIETNSENLNLENVEKVMPMILKLLGIQ